MSWWNRLLKKTDRRPNDSSAQSGCDHGHIELRQGTADFEWFIARAELESGKNLQHGFGHLANLLTYDPGNREWVELLEKYLVAAGPDQESFMPRGEKLYFGTEALRAYLWQKQNRLTDAVELLAEVTRAKPEARYLEAWGLTWLSPSGAIESLPEQLGLRLFAAVLSRFPEAKLSPLARLREIQAWARLAQRFFTDRKAPGVSAMLLAGLLRKAGLFEEAEAAVQPSPGQMSDWHSATALGLALREKGDPEGAERAFRQATQLDTTDVSAWLEAADMFLAQRDWQRAMEWYDGALKIEPKHIWAFPSNTYCRWQLSNDAGLLDELVNLAKSGNQRAALLYNQHYYNRLPEPVDATANIVRKLRNMVLEDPGFGTDGDFKITISSLEAPSNYLAFRLEMEALRRGLTLSVTVKAVAKPDPRESIGIQKYRLWEYTGTDAVPGLAPPSDEIARQIGKLAGMPYDDQANWAAASYVAERMDPEEAPEILAVMVHPPSMPANETALSWLPRVQLAAAQVIGQIGEDWQGSARREALLSVLLGPQDWATNAAIRVLARLGREYEPIAPDVHEAFQQLRAHRPSDGYCCWEHTLFRHWLEVPCLFPAERKEIQEALRKIENPPN